MRVQVPSAIVNNEYPVFPQGAYDGKITAAAVRDPNNDGSWVLIKLTVGDITPREGTADPGRDRFSGDITLRNTDQEGNVQDLRELSEFNGTTHWSIQTGARLLAGLAAGLDVAEVDEAGNVNVDFSQVAEALIDGAFEGQRVGFEVNNYVSKKTKKTGDGFDAFGPAS